MEDCADMSEGECVVLCRDTPEVAEGSLRSRGKEGISALVASDDWSVWTATGASDVKRWRDPGRRSTRMSADTATGWDAASPNTPYTFGFAHLSSNGVSRATTPVPSAPMLRTDSKKSDSSFNPRNDSPRPSSPPISSAMAPSQSHGASAHRPLARQSMQSSYAGSVSFSDEPAMIEPLQGPEHTLFGIPFDSLVKLASPNQVYGIVRTRDPDVATLWSAASVLSVPAHIRPTYTASPLVSSPAPQSSSQSPFTALVRSSSSANYPSSPPATSTYPATSIHQPPGVEALPSPQAAFESREVAVEAHPLSTTPEEIIRGAHGLVRSVILNDRIHALTVDTAGEVALWDLMRGVCRGYFSSSDVEKASQNLNDGDSSTHSRGSARSEWSPREVLETVRERIEGEAMIAAWANVETKMGSLTVHMVESTCFDAEVYADEAGFGEGVGRGEFPEEHRSEWFAFWRLGVQVPNQLFCSFQSTSEDGSSSISSLVRFLVTERFG